MNPIPRASSRPVAATIATLLILSLAPLARGYVPPGKAVQGPTEEPRALGGEPAPPSPEASARWEAFVDREGDEWAVYWNTTTQTPHRVSGKGIRVADRVSEADAGDLIQGFVQSNASLLGADPDNLRLLTRERHGSRWYADYQQTYQGLDVIGGRVHVRLRDNGLVATFGSDFYPGISVSTTPSFEEEGCIRLAKDDTDFNPATDQVLSSRLVVLPVAKGRAATYHLAYETRLRTEREPAIWRVYVDAHSGDVLGKHNEIYYDAIYGNVSGYIKPMYATDPEEQADFRAHYVSVTGWGQTTTDQNGDYAIEVGSGGMREVTALIKGSWAVVTNNSGPEASFVDSVAPGTFKDILWNSSNSIASERTAYYHAWVAHDRIKAIDPGFTGMDRMTPVRVNQLDYCNAYWDGSGITLGAGSGSCLDLGLFADVLYHEYGHGIADFQYRPLAPTGAMHEAFADYFACTITDEPYIGEGILGPGSYFRNSDNTLRYPEDLTGEVHDDGRILAGALWDLRQALWPDVHLADSLFHYARYGKAGNFFDYYSDVIETDDDDGNLANGTPHYYEILKAFGNHGIGPGPYVNVAHVPLGDSEDSLATYPVIATITSNIALDPDSILLYYSTGGAFTEVAMLPTGNTDEYSATIPAQPYGTVVEYYVYAKSEGRTEYATSPDGAPSNLNRFALGADTTPPTVVHTPLDDQPDAAWPPTVNAIVSDNLGLASATLEYSRNGVPQPPVPMADLPGSDVYEASFAVAASAGDYVEYRIVAVDASAAAHTAYDPPSGYYIFGIADATYYTFESGQEGWTHWTTTGWVDEWHVSSQRNHTPDGGSSWKCGSTGTGQYAAQNKSFLETPSIQIQDGAKLVFWHRIDAEAYEPIEGSGIAWDGANVSFVDAGGVATSIDPAGGYPYRILPGSEAPFTANKPVFSGSHGWRREEFDLPSYSGPCKIRFKFGSDGYVGGEGWYIDDVMLWSGDALASIGLCGGDCLESEIPLAFALGSARPNPSAGTTSVSYAVPSPGSHVEIKIFDVNGRLAATIADEYKLAGRYSASWNGTDNTGRRVSPGIYFVKMEARAFSETGKIILVK